MADFPFDDFNGLRNGDNATLNNVKLTQITFPNGSVQTTAGGGAGGEVTGLSFNNSSRKIEITQSSGTSPLDATIPQNQVSTLTFNSGTRILSLSQVSGGTKIATIPRNEVTGMTFDSATGVLTLNQDSGVNVTASGFPTGSGGGTNTFVVNNDLSSEVVNKIKKLEKIVNDLNLEKKPKPEKKILFGKDRILKKKISV